MHQRKWFRAQLSGFAFSSVYSHLLSQVCSLLVQLQQQWAPRIGYKQTFPGNTWKQQLPGQILSLGTFMFFCVYLRHLLPLPHFLLGPVYIDLVPQKPSAVVSHTNHSGWHQDKRGGHSQVSGVPASAAIHCHYMAEKPQSSASAAFQTSCEKVRWKNRATFFLLNPFQSQPTDIQGC